MKRKNYKPVLSFTVFTILFLMTVYPVLSQGRGPNHLGSSYEPISVKGKIIIDSIARGDKKYYLDIDNNNTKDYLLSFGPIWYTPASGAKRPVSGQLVSIDGDLFKDITPPLIVVLKIDGLVWRDSIGARFVHNPLDHDSIPDVRDSMHDNRDHMGNKFGWCVKDSLINVTLSGVLKVDSVSKFHKVYSLDVNTDGKQEYYLMFGPVWYVPKSGAERPVNGQNISITGGMLQRFGLTDSIKFVVVYTLNGLQWIDSIGRYPWPGYMIHRGPANATKVSSIYNSNTCVNYGSNSFGMGHMNMNFPEVYSSIMEIDPVYLPMSTDGNIVAAYSVNVMDDNLGGLYMAFDKGISINLNYNNQDLAVAGTENKNLRLKLLLNGYLSTEVKNAKFNYSNNSVSFSNSVPNGIYVIEADVKSVTAVASESIPKSYSLKQNYPNPFNPSTNISFSIPQKSAVRLKIYSILGNEVRDLLNSNFESGTYSIAWDGKDNVGNKVSSGIYLYKMESDFGIVTRKMNLLK
jgi:hypothetical protein